MPLKQNISKSVSAMGEPMKNLKWTAWLMSALMCGAAVAGISAGPNIPEEPNFLEHAENRFGCLSIDVPESRSLGGRQSQSRHLEELAANTPDQWSSLVIH